MPSLSLYDLVDPDNTAMFITNELTEQMEMPTMTNKEKIASHGFDSKTSFRGK